MYILKHSPLLSPMLQFFTLHTYFPFLFLMWKKGRKMLWRTDLANDYNNLPQVE